MDACQGNNVQHCFLVRHPSKAIRSLHDVNEAAGLSFDPHEAGLAALQMLLRKLDELRAQSCSPALDPIILDADELLADPRGMYPVW